MFAIDSPWALPMAGLACGFVMGFIARRNHFCTMSALERYWYAGDGNGLRAWALAAATALAATQIMVALGVVDVSQSFYLHDSLPIAGSILGGLMFGFGMALVGTCGFGAIVLMGGGSMRALVVLSGIALAAISAQRGLTAHLRAAVIDPLALDLSGVGGQSLAAIMRSLTGVDLALPVALAVALAMSAWIFRDPAFRRDTRKLAAGLVIGLAIAAGWYVTWSYSQILFAPVQIEAGSFVAPVGDLMLQIITVTGALPDYGVGVAVGVFGGAALAAWRADEMRWEACDDARELGRHLVGAFLMGTGGIFAFGCTIGQGVSAFSVMALSAPLAMAGIAIGARMGLGYLLEGAPFGFLRMRHGHEPAE